MNSLQRKNHRCFEVSIPMSWRLECLRRRVDGDRVPKKLFPGLLLKAADLVRTQVCQAVWSVTHQLVHGASQSIYLHIIC